MKPIMATNRHLKIEICAASPDDCLAAERGGADRVELNCALMLGGLTPSIGSLRESLAAIKIPLIAMIRPRAGGFCYSNREFRAMMRDTEAALAEGSAGIAFGILTASGKIDVKRCRAIKQLAGEREVVFHRAFDVVPDPLIAIEKLHDIGFTRIMTSGQEASAYNGAINIASYIEHAAGRIEILPAGGINRFTVADVIRRTGCNQIHASLTRASKDPSVRARPQVSFGGVMKAPENEFTVTDSLAVAGLRQAFVALY
jgi:copper homeostasis protein